MENTIKHRLENLRKSSGKIIITTHHKPDGDAMGSSLALYNYFKNAGIESQVITPTDYADFLWWMPGNDSVIIYEDQVELSKSLVEKAEFVFCLDFNALTRINNLGEDIRSSKANIVMIDHHRDPQDFDHERFCSIDASSTCELIYQYIDIHLDIHFLNSDVAQCIYTGLVTDTGSFRYDSTSSLTIRIAAALLDKGAVPAVIYDHIFDQNNFERIRLLGYFLYNKIEIIGDGKVALATLNKKELDMFNIKTGDTEGFVNYGLSIKGVSMSALIIDRTKIVKMSFRSKGNFPCNTFSAEYFNGGGHKNAAGGSSHEDLETTVERFKNSLTNYMQYFD